MKIEVTFGQYYAADSLNEAYAKGFRYRCKGNFRYTGRNDRDGFPFYENDFFFFDNKEEAEKFANSYIEPFRNEPVEVSEIPPHTKTFDERTAEIEAEKAEKKAKRDAKEAEKAAEKGLTLDEYKKEKSRLARVRRLEKEIAKLESDLDEKRATLAKLR